MKHVLEILAAASLGLLGACAAPPLPDLTPDHPASPRAAESPLAPASTTLSVERATAPHSGTPPEAPSQGQQHMHHDMSGMSMEAPAEKPAKGDSSTKGGPHDHH